MIRTPEKIPTSNEVTTSLNTSARKIASNGGMIDNHNGITLIVSGKITSPVDTETLADSSNEMFTRLSPASFTISSVVLPLIRTVQLEQLDGKLTSFNSCSTCWIIMFSSAIKWCSWEKQLMLVRKNRNEYSRNLIIDRKNIEMPAFLFGLNELV